MLEHTKQGTPLCQFTLATNRPVIRDGKRETDFITCIIWNKLAENLVKFQRKGNLLGIQGELRVDTYEADGKRRYKSYVLVEEVEYLEPKKDMPKDEEEDFKISDIGKILNKKGWWYIAILCVLFYSAVFPFLKYATDLMVNKFGVDENIAGMIPMLLPFGNILLTPLFGGIYDKISA